jgi:hypothetical protein
MNYHRFSKPDGHPRGGDTTYAEEEDGWTIRQITLRAGRVVAASNILCPPWGLVLPDQRTVYEAFGDAVTPITAQEFEAVWGEHLRQHDGHWQATKRAYPVGAPVVGPILCSYPQGVMVALGGDVIGIADLAACRASARWEWMYPGHRVTTNVSGHDEVNQWVVLTAPRVHGDRL